MNLMNYGEHSDPYAELTGEAEWAASARCYDREKKLERIAEWEAWHWHLFGLHRRLCNERLQAIRALRQLKEQEVKGAA